MGQRQSDEGADRDGDRHQDLYLHALQRDEDRNHPEAHARTQLQGSRHRADVHGQGLYDPHLRLRRQLCGHLRGRARPRMGQRQSDEGADRDGDWRQDLYLHALQRDQDGNYPGHR